MSCNEDFSAGRLTKEQILESFMEGFCLEENHKLESISWAMWSDYYTDLSLSIVEDEYFVRMLEAIWRIEEDSAANVTEQETKHLVSNIRAKLRDFSAQSSDEYILRNVFRQFDVNKNGTLCCDELAAMLVKLQLAVPKRHLEALLRKFDRNGNGVVEFEEFVAYLTCDPYK